MVELRRHALGARNVLEQLDGRCALGRQPRPQRPNLPGCKRRVRRANSRLGEIERRPPPRRHCLEGHRPVKAHGFDLGGSIRFGRSRGLRLDGGGPRSPPAARANVPPDRCGSHDTDIRGSRGHAHPQTPCLKRRGKPRDGRRFPRLPTREWRSASRCPPSRAAQCRSPPARGSLVAPTRDPVLLVMAAGARPWMIRRKLIPAKCRNAKPASRVRNARMLLLDRLSSAQCVQSSSAAV